MNELLRQESEKLARMWSRHDAAMLRDYLVSDVEDPRINVQSVLTRHGIVRCACGDGFGPLMQHELLFAAVMNWLRDFAKRSRAEDEPATVLHTLRVGGDNAEGIEIPRYVSRAFASLPGTACGLAVPNYIEEFLAHSGSVGDRKSPIEQPALETFQRLWTSALANENPKEVSVLEPACGSATDYRFLERFGIARLVDYSGFDLCPKNVENARALFPGARFNVGNIFDIPAPDQAFDCVFVHDLFEHLSLAGLETAVREFCRVVRGSGCVGLFSMAEIEEHIVRPVDDYHWNTLSLEKTCGLFAQYGLNVQVIHIGSYLRRQFGCEHTHNPNAYTFILTHHCDGDF